MNLTLYSFPSIYLFLCAKAFWVAILFRQKQTNNSLKHINKQKCPTLIAVIRAPSKFLSENDFFISFKKLMKI